MSLMQSCVLAKDMETALESRETSRATVQNAALGRPARRARFKPE
jgi:hypothetical protein